MRTVAVLDDDASFTELIVELLQQKGYKAVPFASAGKLLDGLPKLSPDLLIMDVHMPGMDGRDILRLLRANAATKRLPVVLVSGAAVDTAEIVLGLKEGADEYLTKPLDAALFFVRIDNLLRRAGGAAAEGSETLVSGPLRLDLAARAASVDGALVDLTRMEFDVLEYFLRHPSRVLTRGLLLQEVWKQPPSLNTRTVDKHVEKLRKKLGDFGSRFETVVNMGYVFKPPEGAGA